MFKDHLHDKVTTENGYQYLFTGKHHGAGGDGDATWHPELPEADEFGVFERADVAAMSDEDGRLYGLVRDEAGEVRTLGTWQQQVAEFPSSRAGIPWHGYPIWGVNHDAPSNRRHQRMRPAKSVFQKMCDLGWITPEEKSRLFKGDHV